MTETDNVPMAPFYAFSSVISERDADSQLVQAEHKYGPNSPQAEYARAYARACESVPQAHIVGSANAEYVRAKHGLKP